MRTMAVDLALICASSGRVIQKRSAQHVLERGREVAQKSDYPIQLRRKGRIKGLNGA